MGWVKRAAVAVLLLWSGSAAAAGLRSALAREPDARTRSHAALEALVAGLPSHGTVGYLQGGAAEESAFHAVQYAVAPRVLVHGAGPEYLIVAGGRRGREGISLTGYEPVGAAAAGHQVYRRVR